MYEELVCQVRKWTENYARMCGAGATTQLVTQAADAIEELSRAQEQWIEQERKMLLKSLPRWIPVTERLPEDRSDVLVYLKYEVSGRIA